ncbi:O-antigen ligase family protein [Cupriavidus sp. TMH.W2]|uniref:O-antigen ligase family protein n=1 Tax=Cupriavidus sp. TMH.W2 TaxID=3434465 RepID=UPI003D77D420
MGKKKLQLLYQWLTTSLLLVYPVVALLIHNAGNAIAFLFVALALVALAMRLQPERQGFAALLRSYWPLHLAMVSACLAILFQQAWSGDFGIKYYDRALRLAAFPLIFWVLFFVPRRHFQWLQWGVVLAAIVAMVKAYIFTKGGNVRDGNIGFISIIAYSDIALLAGVLALVSFAWNEPKQKLVLLAKMGACAAGLYTSVLTATRGSWLALPLFLVFFLFFARLNIRHRWAWVASLVLVVAVMFGLNQHAASRFVDTQSDLQAYSQGEGKSTSTGHRLQLWGAALKLIAKAPVFGIGRENYDAGIREMVHKHEVTEDLMRFAHSHNEILFNMVISGIFGLASILLLYLVPGYYFARELGHADRAVRTAARMGCVLVLGFFAFGLTDLMFFWPVLAGYYPIMVAAFLAFIIKTRQAAGPPAGPR